ncbi:hypothetical protein [Actinoplanes sp. NPDC026619]
MTMIVYPLSREAFLTVAVGILSSPPKTAVTAVNAEMSVGGGKGGFSPFG